MPPPPFFRLASCCSLVKRSSLNISPPNSTVRSLAYTPCSDVAADSSSNTNVLSHHPVGKSTVVIETFEQLKRQRSSALSYIRELKESDYHVERDDLETCMSVVRLVCHWDWGLSSSDDELLKDVIKNTDDWKGENFKFCFVNKNEKLKISDHLFEAMMEERLIKAVEVLVKVYATAGMFDKAMHALSEMKRRSGLMVSTHMCNFVINQLIKQDKVDMVESVYGQMKRNGLIPNVSTYGSMITVHCRKGRLKEAWQVFSQMEEAGVEPNARLYILYIQGLCLNGKTNLAFEVVKNLRESNKPVDGLADALVMRGFVNDSRLQDAEQVFLDMKVRDVVPDERCYESLIRGYCKEGEIVKALALCKEMESRGLIDNMFVRWMMRHLWRLGMHDEALYVFKHFMQQSRPRVFIDEASFEIAIDAACKLGKMDDAMELVAEMKGRKIKPLVMEAPTGTN